MNHMPDPSDPAELIQFGLREVGNAWVRTTSIKEIISDPEFAIGFGDRLRGVWSERRDVTRGHKWTYERGRAFAVYLQTCGIRIPGGRVATSAAGYPAPVGGAP